MIPPLSVDELTRESWIEINTDLLEKKFWHDWDRASQPSRDFLNDMCKWRRYLFCERVMYEVIADAALSVDAGFGLDPAFSVLEDGFVSRLKGALLVEGITSGVLSIV